MSENGINLTSEQATEPFHRHRWMSTMLGNYGMKCRLHDSRTEPCNIRQQQVGDLLVMDVKIAHQAVSPILREDACWNGDHLFLKVIDRGCISIEKAGSVQTFAERGVVAVDPLFAYTELFDEPSSMTVLRLPKQAFRDRGIRYTFQDVYVGDTSSPDVNVVCDFILFLASLGDTHSSDLRRRMADQCLDYLDVIFSEESKSGRKRTAASTLVLRAKQKIRHLARNPDLDVPRMARELNVSTNYLTRAFRTVGETPMHYLTSLRLKLACQLLTETQLQIKEIAFKCGFSSTSRFHKVFRRELGTSPAEFALLQQFAVSRDGEEPPAQPGHSSEPPAGQ